MTEIYLVGGAVRDQLMGIEPHDFDFTIVADSYNDMKMYLVDLGVHIWLEKPEYGTIRGRFDRSYVFNGIELDGMSVDFVLSRKEGFYTDGRHPDETTPGSLYDDLSRRDFTVNAIAVTKDGVFIDPFLGRQDLEIRLLRAVGVAEDRFFEDALRVLRAVRFVITKNFTLHEDVWFAMKKMSVLDRLRDNISTDRIRNELDKCFKHDSLFTVDFLARYQELRSVIFEEAPHGHNLWLQTTSKAR